MGSKDDLWRGICSLIIAVSTCATSIIPDIRDSKHQRQYGVSWPRSTDELDNVHTTPRKSHNATPCTLPSPNGQPRWPSHETHRRPHNSRLPLPLRARRHSTHDNPHRQPKTRPQIHNLRSTLRFLHGANNNMYHASCLRQLRTERTHCYRSTDLRRSRRTLTLHHQPDLHATGNQSNSSTLGMEQTILNHSQSLLRLHSPHAHRPHLLHRPSLLHTLHHHQRYRPHRPTRRLNILRRRSIPAHPPPSTQLPHPPQTSYMPILLSWRQRTQSRKIWHWKILILVTTSSLLTFGAAFRAGIAYVPRPKQNPAWYHDKAWFYVVNFAVEIIFVGIYAFVRVDRRFHVPDGSCGPGDYLRRSDGSLHGDLDRQLSRGSDGGGGRGLMRRRFLVVVMVMGMGCLSLRRLSRGGREGRRGRRGVDGVGGVGMLRWRERKVRSMLMQMLVRGRVRNCWRSRL